MPTGAGKTEAYLGLAAFVMAYRRRRNIRRGKSGAGTAILTRYTLRLLTIQQFRRALQLITACELLRVLNLGQGPAGWRPAKCDIKDDFLWGTSRFSIGLWVGGEMTPNRLYTFRWYRRRRRRRGGVYGAIDMLRGIEERGEFIKRGEPAQVINCPCCGALLSIPNEGLRDKRCVLHLVFSTTEDIPQGYITPGDIEAYRNIRVESLQVRYLSSSDDRKYYTATFELTASDEIKADDVDRWWEERVLPALRRKLGDVRLECARPSRPGYFIKTFRYRDKELPYDFEIFCPNPECELNKHDWCEGVPCGLSVSKTELPESPDSNKGWLPVPPPFRKDGKPYIASRVPIPAYTVDDQIYHRCPTMIIATVDKFARLPFEPRAASMFGDVNRFHIYYGYYREWIPPPDVFTTGSRPNRPLKDPRPDDPRYITTVDRLDPPDLIIQDELHLIAGPLGSLVGLYETAIDALCSQSGYHVKYIASTATIRKASEQVKSLFLRRLFVFPPPGLDADDAFFIRTPGAHPLDECPGRLYVGICAPGKGAKTPVVRIWALLLQVIYHLLRDENEPPDRLDPYWTVVGYFNAIRELAGALALYKQDVLERLKDLEHRYGKQRPPREHIELSSRIGSTELPIYLSVLEEKSLKRHKPEEVPVAIFTTNIFGVGVDIPRLGLMIVHGQPKTTSAYIQATGRIGRRNPGIIVTFYRATRPRDLSHYEFFMGYHGMLHRFVEPITVFPFATRVRERAMGPVAVALLRCAAYIEGVHVYPEWGVEQVLSGGQYHSRASLMAERRTEPEINALVNLIVKRGCAQPENRRPDPNRLKTELQSDLDRWHDIATTEQDRLVYWERRPPGEPSVYPQVLGDAFVTHQSRADVVFKNVPLSLREIEETIGFDVPGGSSR